MISGKGRNKLLETGGYNIADYLQTDTSINPGNSGGPLCDIDGKVVGMNTLINGLNRGLGFAIPSNLVNEIGQQLIAGQKIVRPWLGIRIETLGDDSSIRDLFKGIDKGRGRAHDRSRRAGLQKRPAAVRRHHPDRWRTGHDRHAIAARDFEKEGRAKRRAGRLAERARR